jgi:hypothetical protein
MSPVGSYGTVLTFQASEQSTSARSAVAGGTSSGFSRKTRSWKDVFGEGSACGTPLRAPSTQDRRVSLLVVYLTGTIRHVELRLSFAVLTAAVRVSMS